MTSLAVQLEPVLVEIESALWEKEANLPNVPHGYTDLGFRASLKIFMSAILDKSYIKCKRDNLSEDESCKRIEALGHRLRKLVFEFTDIDTEELYKESRG